MLLRLALLFALLGATSAHAQLPAVGVAESVSTVTLTNDQAQAAAAVVRVPSHGISATVVWTGPGKSYLLTCAHGHRDPADRAKKMAFDFPWPESPAGPKRAASRIVGIDTRGDIDLTLIEFSDGPLPFVCPVAPRGHVLSPKALSVGYDEMKWPQQQLPATVARTAYTYTREVPWHGRSGGALIDGGRLVGVVSGYTWTPGTRPPTGAGAFPNAKGMYISHATICQFLDRHNAGWLIGAAVDPTPGSPSPTPPSAGSPSPPAGGSPTSPDLVQMRRDLAAIGQQLAHLQRQLEQMQGSVPTAPPRPPPQQPPACPDGRCPLPPPPGPRVAPLPPACRH